MGLGLSSGGSALCSFLVELQQNSHLQWILCVNRHRSGPPYGEIWPGDLEQSRKVTVFSVTDSSLL